MAKPFYLVERNGRQVITENAPPGAHPDTFQTVMANCWLDAKRKFGFPLSINQAERLLAGGAS